MKKTTRKKCDDPEYLELKKERAREAVRRYRIKQREQRNTNKGDCPCCQRCGKPLKVNRRFCETSEEGKSCRSIMSDELGIGGNVPIVPVGFEKWDYDNVPAPELEW
jgi:hypothetical protein